MEQENISKEKKNREKESAPRPYRGAGGRHARLATLTPNVVYKEYEAVQNSAKKTDLWNSNVAQLNLKYGRTLKNEPQNNVATGTTAKSNITVPAKCNITVPNPRSLKEMQMAYFQHQNSLAVTQEAYYLKMASLADTLNVLADISIAKIHTN
ncbi:hypothetical protein DPMN_131894 [Dreissena polymorpha]|uniref:Uncharacterized protein n=1 Tax=Dreissena polymorpha TaxID=45954 RepID=A0A9D4JCN2_DREPO|nr:hypothetical protein DPMN_131894 [Dreissena polymorpha]